MKGKKILVIDDDIHINRVVQAVFTAEGAEVFLATNGQEGLRQFYTHQPDLVIIDLMMPVMNGWETSQRMLELADVPIIMLTSLHEDADIVRGLESGAIDYMTKPFSAQVLIARAKVALRQTAAAKPAGNHAYRDGYLTVDLHEKSILVQEKSIKLTKTEYKLFSYLIQNAGRILTFQQILDHVWGWGYENSTEYVHVYISRLRQKLEENPKKPNYLLTEFGIGYRFKKQTPPKIF